MRPSTLYEPGGQKPLQAARDKRSEHGNQAKAGQLTLRAAGDSQLVLRAWIVSHQPYSAAANVTPTPCRVLQLAPVMHS